MRKDSFALTCAVFGAFVLAGAGFRPCAAVAADTAVSPSPPGAATALPDPDALMATG